METTEQTPTDHGADTARVLEERARRLASRRRDERDDGELRLVVVVGPHLAALPLSAARHVVATPALAALPSSGSLIMGLATVLGDLVPVADLTALLEFDPTSRPGGSWVVVIDDGGGQLGLLVDRVEGITTVDHDDAHRPEQPSRPSGLVAGIGTGGLLLLDVAALSGDPRLWPSRPVPDRSEGAT